MNYLFTSESVSDGHPDKLADQISDAILDNYLAFDQESKVACETVVTTGQVIIAGEVFSSGIPDHHKIIRDTIAKWAIRRKHICFLLTHAVFFRHCIHKVNTSDKAL